MTKQTPNKAAFVAGSHLCWFSKKYPKMSVNDVILKDPEYIRWCIDNLKHLRFATGVRVRVNNAIKLLK